MNSKEKIKLLEKQVELLEKVIELQRLAAPVITVTPYVTREVYPNHLQYPWTSPFFCGSRTSDPLPKYPVITC